MRERGIYKERQAERERDRKGEKRRERQRKRERERERERERQRKRERERRERQRKRERENTYHDSNQHGHRSSEFPPNRNRSRISIPDRGESNDGEPEGVRDGAEGAERERERLGERER